MTNQLVGDVYLKIIGEVVRASTNDFEESGVGQATLGELQQEWQTKLSQRQVAQMPWDPRPDAVQRPVNGLPTPASNNGQPSNYNSYENENPSAVNGRAIKVEGGETYQQPPPVFTGSTQGGAVRAQQLVEQQFGSQAAANLQQRGLALPGQKPQPLQLPGQGQQQYSPQQQQALQRQQQALQNQQTNPQIKLEEGSPNLQQGQFAQQRSNLSYNQNDGAGEEEQWRAYMAYRRTLDTATIARNDHMMRDSITLLAHEMESGLMLPYDDERIRNARRLKLKQLGNQDRSYTSSSKQRDPIPQLDGDVDDDDDQKLGLKLDDEDEDAINSDLDDPDDDQNPIGDDDDDLGDTILCTYDKVQRVKNKWKCILKDGVLNTGGKEYLFHKGNGEFEW